MGKTARRLRRRTWIIIGSGALVLVLAAVVVFVWVIPASRTVDASAQQQTQTSEASLQTLEQTVEATGTLTPLVNESVDFEASGTVQSVEVAVGDTVEKGDTLATIDDLQVTADLTSAQATLAEAQATLSEAEADSDGSDAAVAKITAAEASVAVAQESVDEAQAAMDDVTLVAPVSGIVTSIDLAVGDAVSGGSTSGSGSAGTGDASANASTGSTDTSSSQFTIVGTSSWEIDVTVDATGLEQIAVDDAARITLDDGTEIEGSVSGIGLIPDTSSGSAAFPVTITADAGDATLYDGLSGTVEIVYESRDDVLTVPSNAVTTAQDGTSTVELQNQDGTTTTTTVEVGETVGDLTEITAGLSEGDSVVVTVFTPGATGTDGDSGDTQDMQFPGGGSGDFQMPDGGTLPDGGSFSGGQGTGGQG